MPSLLPLFLLLPFILAGDDPKVQVKLMSPKHFRINQNDLERLKEEIAIDMRSKIQKLTQRWFINDKIREKQIGAWSQNPSYMNPYSFQNQQSMLFGSPQFREQLYSQVQNQLAEREKEGDPSKVDDLEKEVAKQTKEVAELKKTLKKIEDNKVETTKEDKDQRLQRFKQVPPQDSPDSLKAELQLLDGGKPIQDTKEDKASAKKEDEAPAKKEEKASAKKEDEAVPFGGLLTSIGDMFKDSKESLQM